MSEELKKDSVTAEDPVAVVEEKNYEELYEALNAEHEKLLAEKEKDEAEKKSLAEEAARARADYYN